MTQYIRFASGGREVLIEADIAPDGADAGPTKAGLLKRTTQRNVFDATASLDDALGNALAANAQAVDAAAEKLEHRPDEIELTFGLKAAGELGNIAIAKVSAEATMSVRILWKPAEIGRASSHESGPE